MASRDALLTLSQGLSQSAGLLGQSFLQYRSAEKEMAMKERLGVMDIESRERTQAGINDTNRYISDNALAGTRYVSDQERAMQENVARINTEGAATQERIRGSLHLAGVMDTNRTHLLSVKEQTAAQRYASDRLFDTAGLETASAERIANVRVGAEERMTAATLAASERMKEVDRLISEASDASDLQQVQYQYDKLLAIAGEERAGALDRAKLEDQRIRDALAAARSDARSKEEREAATAALERYDRLSEKRYELLDKKSEALNSELAKLIEHVGGSEKTDAASEVYATVDGVDITYGDRMREIQNEIARLSQTAVGLYDERHTATLSASYRRVHGEGKGHKASDNKGSNATELDKIQAAEFEEFVKGKVESRITELFSPQDGNITLPSDEVRELEMVGLDVKGLLAWRFKNPDAPLTDRVLRTHFNNSEIDVKALRNLIIEAQPKNPRAEITTYKPQSLSRPIAPEYLTRTDGADAGLLGEIIGGDGRENVFNLTNPNQGIIGARPPVPVGRQPYFNDNDFETSTLNAIRTIMQNEKVSFSEAERLFLERGGINGSN